MIDEDALQMLNAELKRAKGECDVIQKQIDALLAERQQENERAHVEGREVSRQIRQEHQRRFVELMIRMGDATRRHGAAAHALRSADWDTGH